MAPFSAYQALLAQAQQNKLGSLRRQQTNQGMIDALNTAPSPALQMSAQFGGGLSGLGSNAGLTPGASGKAGQLINYAKKWLGTDYSYGGGNMKGPSRGINQGRNIIGFDCSGLVQQVYNHFGIKLPSVSRDQSKYGKAVNSKNARPGDLVFFSSRGLPVGHVGIYLGNGQMLEAPRTGLKVRVGPVWKKGVFGYRRVL